MLAAEVLRWNESWLRLGCLVLLPGPLTCPPVVWLLRGDDIDRLRRCVDRNHLERCVDPSDREGPVAPSSTYVSLEAEIPEVLYQGMKEFIGSHPSWDQYQVMSSALANFLFQNGCDDRAVTERYLNDLFSRSHS